MTASEPAGQPAWLPGLLERVAQTDADWFGRHRPDPEGVTRESAVLVLLGPDEEGSADQARVVLTARAAGLRTHAGQTSFPGGGREDDDADLAATALREAHEEIGVDPGSVDVLSTLPPVHIPVSGYAVTPVIGWWREPGRVWARDPSEVDRVVIVPVSRLVDPAHRFQVRHPSGYVGPAFDADGLLVWGFTAGVLSRLLDLAGLAEPWDERDVRALDAGSELIESRQR